MRCIHAAENLTTRQLTQRAAFDEECHQVLSEQLNTAFCGIQYLRNEGDEEAAQQLANIVEEHIINRSPKSVHQKAAELERARGYV